MGCHQRHQRRDGVAAAAPASLPRPTADRRTDRSPNPMHGGPAVPIYDESPADPWAAVLGAEFASEPTSGIPVPDPAAPWWQLAEFALTFDGYTRFGGFDRLSHTANAAAEEWQNRKALPATLDEARGLLFFEQRRHRHMASDPRGTSLDYVRALVQRIHDLSGGAVRPEVPNL
jgi:hypothetical protein